MHVSHTGIVRRHSNDGPLFAKTAAANNLIKLEDSRSVIDVVTNNGVHSVRRPLRRLLNDPRQTTRLVK